MLRQAFAHCAIFPTAASRRSVGRVSVPLWLVILSDQLWIIALVSHYLTNKLIQRRPISYQITPFMHSIPAAHLCGISTSFPVLSPSKRQVIYALLTRPPLSPKAPFDLHVLSIPPAFVLSQDQTLHNQYQKKAPTHHWARPRLNTVVLSFWLADFLLTEFGAFSSTVTTTSPKANSAVKKNVSFITKYYSVFKEHRLVKGACAAQQT